MRDISTIVWGGQTDLPTTDIVVGVVVLVTLR